MPVSISEFEIITEAAPASGGASSGAAAPGAPGKPLSPMELRDILRQQAERLARLSAW